LIIPFPGLAVETITGLATIAAFVSKMLRRNSPAAIYHSPAIASSKV